MDNTSTGEVFYIEFKDKKFPCKVMQQPAGNIFLIKFETRVLCLTKFNSGDELYWTAVPADSKLNHIVLELGSKIDQHYKTH